MKKLAFSTILVLLFTTLVYTQPINSFPEGMQYQAVARDASGDIMANQDVNLKVLLKSLRRIFYAEAHSVTTNEFGLFTLTVGKGLVEDGNFTDIPWSRGNIWIEIQIQNDQGAFETINSSKLWSVPYAFHSKTTSELSTPPWQTEAYWSTSGNSNTNPEQNFLGTTDETNLVFKTNNEERLKLSSDGDLGITTNTGDLNVTENLNVTEDLVVIGKSKLDTITSQLTVISNIQGSQTNYNAYPLRVEGGNQGIAVKLNSEKPNRDQNYITFFATDMDGKPDAQGRIEGSKPDITVIKQIWKEMWDGNDWVWIDGVKFNFNESNDMAKLREKYFHNNYTQELLESSIDLVVLICHTFIDIGLSGGTAGVWEDYGDVIFDVIDLVLEGTRYGKLIKSGIETGVAFESGGADYAEWLKKAYPDEKIAFGEVVGIKNGVISKTFLEADQFLAVTSNPIIVGGMPEKGLENGFEKVALMGQVPILVFGEVAMGDYILPSGNGDGNGIAINPKDMKANDFSKIIGVAWSESGDNSLYNYINTAVGFNANQMGMVVNNMQTVMNAIQEELVKLNPEYKPVYFDSSGHNLNTINQLNEDETYKEAIALMSTLADCPQCSGLTRNSLKCHIKCWINNPSSGNGINPSGNAIRKIVKLRNPNKQMFKENMSVILEVMKEFGEEHILPFVNGLTESLFDPETGIIDISEFDDFPMIQDLLIAVRDHNFDEIGNIDSLQERIDNFKKTLKYFKALQE